MKKPFVTKEQLEDIVKQYPTPFHLYDEKGMRENARRVNAAFSWNPGFKEYFAVKATPTPALLKILRQEGCGADCSSLTELMMAEKCGFLLYKRRVRVGRRLTGMPGEAYAYFRKY